MHNMTKLILLVGNRQDLHIQTVANHIKSRGYEYRIFDRYSEDKISARFEQSSELLFSCEEGVFSGSEIAVAWWRLKPIKIWSPENTELAIASEFSGREWRSLLFSIPLILDHVHWINKFPHHIMTAYKPYQMKLARQVGLSTPYTLFSNNPQHIQDLVKRNDRTIYKQFSNFMFPGNDFVFTSEITQHDLEGADESLAVCPGIYQPLVEKAFEWRITLVGRELHCVVIESQKATATSIDWRRSQSENMYKVGVIDKGLADKIIDYSEKSGIEYAAFDFIETKTGEMIFLECNPAGQWLWLEEMTGIRISEALSTHLIRSLMAGSA